jgi:probable F420-dependent oxidoreductase
MHLGYLSTNSLDERPDALALALEERGYESLWLGEHTHIPVSRATPYPAGEPLPAFNTRMLDPFVALMAAAAATSRLRVGTAVTLALEHDVLSLAKAVATVDQLSGGRLSVGLGVGWNVEELASHSPLPWRQRYSALAERVAALKVLWTDDEASFHGRFVDFDPVFSFPKPLQRPHPPLICGMAGPLGTRHATEWADGWMPLDVGQNMVKKIGRFRAAVDEAGRDPTTVEISVAIVGQPDDSAVLRYRDLGIDRVVVGGTRPGWEEPSTLLPFLDRYAALLPELGG